MKWKFSELKSFAEIEPESVLAQAPGQAQRVPEVTNIVSFESKSWVVEAVMMCKLFEACDTFSYHLHPRFHRQVTRLTPEFWILNKGVNWSEWNKLQSDQVQAD